ncbi:MAG: VanW family protein [Candidatus Falkowbacteria bacterium]
MNKIIKNKKAIIITVVFLLLISGFTSWLYSDWNNNYRNHINPGIKIGQIDLSGLTFDQAEKKISAEADRLESTGLPFSYGGKKIILPGVIAVNTDLSFPVFTYNRDETLKELTLASPPNSFISYLLNYLKKTFSDKNISMIYFLDESRAKAYIRENLDGVEVPPLNAAFEAKKDINGISFTIDPERIGRQIDFDLALEQLNDQLKKLDNQNIPLKTITSRPLVHASDLESLQPAAESLISRGDLTLTANGIASSSWVIKKATLASWIISEGETGNYHLSLDTNKIADYLKNNISPTIDQEAKKTRYEMINGKISSWQTGAAGRKLNLENSAIKIKEQYLVNGLLDVELVVDDVQGDLSKNTDEFNIQEIIGTGKSTFSGSPANRRHNIQVGADAVNGILIAPGEEFSLVKALGEIDASSGYLPELVIKNNKTIPEYGGGLCQVGTTIFRSALMSGLPITARQNHSYRVAYYEPAGTDAAIYDPWPDVRFVNDSGNYILIQSRIVKDNLYFDFWGKKDGRIATSTTPVVYNITKPEPAKLIETTDLKPGEKKCTEKAHNGADAYFDYSVTYPSGDIKSNRFKSHYVPWQEVCLIGKTNASSTPIVNIASTTHATSTN